MYSVVLVIKCTADTIDFAGLGLAF